jgi:putative selenate reductase
MSGLFQPITADQLFSWVFSALDSRDSVLGIPREHFFVPGSDAAYESVVFGHRVETPFGPAAGPHTQMAQNIVAAWLCGARYIELKTVQTLDELDVAKPCIDMTDEGYNVEWSQELRVHESVEEYVRAWVVIHALHHRLGFPGNAPGVVFNLSVGYDLAGIQQANMQWFLDQMQNIGERKRILVEQLARHYPAVTDLEIPDRLSNNVTLSTMHGCPPWEIESISAYLMRERGLHTLVKCNPTLLGPERVRKILNEDLRYRDVAVPDEAFGHDLEYSDAVPMLRNLRGVADACGLEFGVKLSNTLEVENSGSVFTADEKTMYLSGRPLHAITVNLASMLAREFDGGLLMSFSAGANCFNAPDLLAAGMQTVTTCSDLLKTGGYLRLLQYIQGLDDAMAEAGATSLDEFRVIAKLELTDFAQRTISDPMYVKDTFDTGHTKTNRELRYFDCIEAPCVGECPLQQKVPQYMRAVRDGDDALALRIVRTDNPLPCVLGRVCDHLCEQVCVRNHLDEPVAIRDIKRFISDLDELPAAGPTDEPAAVSLNRKVAIVGAGPGGMAAAHELAAAGCRVEVFEQQTYAGGMTGGTVPEYRLPGRIVARDLAPLEGLGVTFHYGKRAGRDFSLSQLWRDGFDNIVIMAGAQLGKSLGLEHEDCAGVIDALTFLRHAREDKPVVLGDRIGVIGAGDTAIDCARVANRLAAGDVCLVYRRTIDQMPADREEAEQLLEEGIEVVELCTPDRLIVANGALRGIVCRRMEYKGDRDASGRKIPHEVPGSEFEMPFDTLIIAISQGAILDFLEGESIKLNERGFIDVDPVTFETSSPGVYAGGDVANDGPATIVKAAAAGKAIARAILNSEDEVPRPVGAKADTTSLARRKAQRAWRVPAPQLPLKHRQGFDEVMLTYDDDQAREEASRCLDCDVYCSMCVGVCPNLALQTYETGISVPGARQRYQVAVIADLCNECGNCTTFCPTAGKPYRDKPRLYLDRSEFDAEDDNAFMVFRTGAGWSMDARYRGETHHLGLDDDKNDAQPYAAMHVLLSGIARSMPQLPVVENAGPAS